MNQAASPQSAARAVSGKLVIISIFAVALLAAGTAWVFRYNATHRAAEFWGPTGARLIRDARHVTLNRVFLSSVSKTSDLSHAPGITHLRNALLEDRSFQWGQSFAAAPKYFPWKLVFSDPSRDEQFTILFTSDCHGAQVDQAGPNPRSISTEPISKGLLEVFAEHISEAEPAAR